MLKEKTKLLSLLLILRWLFLNPRKIPLLSRRAWRIFRQEGVSGLKRAFQSFVRRVQYEDTLTTLNQHIVSNDNRYFETYISQLNTAQNKRGDEHIEYNKNLDLSKEDLPAKLIAFYLPQFHPIPENDQWWGKGFTEWTNVSKAVPHFVGHYQPRLPGELGFYDLRVPDVQRRQVELAKKYGIYGFCFYYYWFNGKKLLERPLKQFVSDPEIDFPFCICWANENWTRRWDGLDQEILIAQNHSLEGDVQFIEDILPYLQHRNYIRIQGRPLLLVYRAHHLSNPKIVAQRWREFCQKKGLPDLYLVAVQGFGFFDDPQTLGFDAAVEFPPFTPIPLAPIPQQQTAQLQFLNPDFKGVIYNYEDVVRCMLQRSKPPYRLFRTVMPGWDNTARRLNNPTIFINSSPGLYKMWLFAILNETFKECPPEERIVFVNAWNEWAEGNYLEPDRKYGYAYLESTASALKSLRNISKTKEASTEVIKRYDTAIILHLYYVDLWEEINSFLANLGKEFDLYISVPEGITFPLEKILKEYPHAYIYQCKNRGRDIAPFLHIFQSYLLNYKYVCKIHTKRSRHRPDGDIWRRDMLQKLLGSSRLIHQAKRILDEEKNVGIVAPKGHVVPGYYYLGSNKNKIEILARLVNIPFHLDFYFVAGTMFWFRPAALYPLTQLPITANDFEVEQGQRDGTLAHAIERFIGLVAQSQGFGIVELTEEGPLWSPPIRPSYRFADPSVLAYGEE